MAEKQTIAVSNYHYRYHPFPLFVENQKKLGYSAVEIWGGAPHFYLDDTTAAGFQQARELLEAAGLTVAAFVPESVSTLYGLCAWNDTVRQKARGYYRNAIDGAAILGAPVVVLHCAGDALDEPKLRAYRRAVSGLRELGGYAREKGVTLAIETNCPEEGGLLHTLPELRELLEEVDLPSVRAGFSLCPACLAGETMAQWFRQLGDKIAHVDFSDGTPAGHLVWGEGNHPLEDCLAELRGLGWQGTLGMRFDREAYFFAPEAADRANLACWEQAFPGKEDC